MCVCIAKETRDKQVFVMDGPPEYLSTYEKSSKSDKVALFENGKWLLQFCSKKFFHEKNN